MNLIGLARSFAPGAEPRRGKSLDNRKWMTKFGGDREETGNRKIYSSEIDLTDRTVILTIISWKAAQYAYLVEEVQDEVTF